MLYYISKGFTTVSDDIMVNMTPLPFVSRVKTVPRTFNTAQFACHRVVLVACLMLSQIAAVLLVSPTYEGACLDVESAAKSCHAAGIPLVVDEAHGAHLAFLGTDDDDRSDVPKGKEANAY